MPKISDEQRAAAKQRLIDATIAVAHRDGVEALTTRAIVAEAGVSSGMFYGHFGSKEELLAAVVDERVDELTTVLAAEIDLGTPIEGVVRELLHQLIVISDLRVLSVFRAASTTDEGRETQRRINRRIVDAFVPVFSAAVEAGLVRDDVDAEAAIEFIDLVTDGLNRRRELDGFVTSDERLAAAALAAIESFLLVQPPGATA